MYSVYVIDFKDATVEYDINLNLLIFCFVLIMRPVFLQRCRYLPLKYLNKKSEMCVQQISQIKTLITKCNNLDRFLKVKVPKGKTKFDPGIFLVCNILFSVQ